MLDRLPSLWLSKVISRAAKRAKFDVTSEPP
jgi:hypothetical protein